MASKKKLHGQVEYLRGLYFQLSDELADLEGDWRMQATEYEADLNAAESREVIAVGKLAKLADQATTVDRVIRERDKALRELQAARVAAEALGKALYPMTYAKGGLLGPADGVPKYTINVGNYDEFHKGMERREQQQAAKGAVGGNVGDLPGLSPAANETYRSIMDLKNNSWQTQAYQRAVSDYTEGRTPPIADSPGPGWRELGKQPFGGADPKPDA